MNCGLKAYKKKLSKALKFITICTVTSLHWQNAGFTKIERRLLDSPRKYGKTKFGINRFFNGYLDLLTLWFLSVLVKANALFGFLGSLMFFVGFINNSCGASKIYAMKTWIRISIDYRLTLFLSCTTAMLMGLNYFLLVS